MPYRLMWKTKQTDPETNKQQTILIPLLIEQSPTFQSLGFVSSTYGFRQIDLFTARFTNIIELKKHLIGCGILARQNVNDELVIAWEGEHPDYRKKHHSLFFMDTADYLVTPLDKLEDYMNDCAIDEDYAFFSDLINAIFDLSLTPKQEAIINHFQDKLEDVDTNLESKFIVLPGNNGCSEIQNFLKALVFRPSPANNTRNGSSPEFNWWMVHLLIDFVINYSKQHACKRGTPFTRVQRKRKNSQIPA